MKLRTKLMLDAFLNLDLIRLDPHEATRHILYLINFAKIQTELKFADVLNIIRAEMDDLLLPLPDNPNSIDKEMLDAIPFALPIKDKRQTGTVARVLRLAYTFTLIPESYFNDTRILLPDSPSLLTESLKDLFPITSFAELKSLSKYKEKLQESYIVYRIPDTYFDLPPPKPRLPCTLQELSPRLREIFPFLLRDAEDFKRHMRLLKENYTFSRLPNDYIIQKRRLPLDPNKLQLESKYTFPITEKAIAHTFINEIPTTYQIPMLFPPAYMTVNPTELPDLPEDHMQVDKVNLTIPITTPKQLSIAVKDLRKYYYFRKIPESWIRIENSDRTTDDTL